MRKPIFTSEFGTISACNPRAAPTMIKFVVPRFFVEGLSLFAGKPKAGKSWLLLHAALAVAGVATRWAISSALKAMFYTVRWKTIHAV
jgi:hypothetical protein